MKAKYTITKIGEGKKVLLPDSKIVLNEKTTQKDLKKLHELGYTTLVQKDEAKEDSSESENATD